MLPWEDQKQGCSYRLYQGCALVPRILFMMPILMWLIVRRPAAGWFAPSLVLMLGRCHQSHDGMGLCLWRTASRHHTHLSCEEASDGHQQNSMLRLWCRWVNQMHVLHHLHDWFWCLTGDRIPPRAWRTKFWHNCATSSIQTLGRTLFPVDSSSISLWMLIRAKSFLRLSSRPQRAPSKKYSRGRQMILSRYGNLAAAPYALKNGMSLILVSGIASSCNMHSHVLIRPCLGSRTWP